MATGYWKGANNGTWSVTTNWAANLDATGTISVVPGAGETAFFNANGTTTARDVYLNGSRSIGTLSFNSNNGGLGLRGGTSAVPATQTLTLGSGGIDMAASGGNINSYSSVTLSIANALTPLNVIGGRGAFIDGLISGTGGWSISGAGIAQFTNASSTYSGGTTVNAGTVRIGANSTGSPTVTSGPLGTGTLTLNDGTKVSSNSTTPYAVMNNLTVNGSVTITDATNTGQTSFGGTTLINTTATINAPRITNLYGPFTGSAAVTLAPTSPGQIFLSGTTGNTYSGAVTINGTGDVLLATINAGTPNQLSLASSINVTLGYLYFAGASSTTINRTIFGVAGDGNNGGIIVENTAGVTFSGNLTTGNGAGFTGRFYTRSGADESPAVTWSTTASYPSNALVIQAAHPNANTRTHTRTYSGADNISTTRTYWGHDSFGSAFTALFRHYGSTGTTFTIGGVGPWVSNDGSFDVTLQYDVASGNTLAINVPLKEFYAGKFLLTKLGTGTLTLTGDNQLSKAVSVSAGTLNANSVTALGAASSTAAISVSSGATLSAGAALNYSSPGRTTTISGTGVSSAGALVINHAGAVNVGVISLGAAALIRGTADGGSLTSNITGTQSLTVGVDSGKTVTFSGTINTSTGTLTIGETATSTGTVVLSQASTRSGANTLTFGTARVENATALGSGAITFNGGTIDASTTLTLANPLTVSSNITFGGTAGLTLSSAMALGASRTITTNGSQSLTLSGAVSGAGFKLTKQGASRLVLTNGSNSYSGGTDLFNGTIEFANGGLGSIGAISIPGATLVWASGNTQDISSRLTLTSGFTAVLDTGANNVSFSSSFGAGTSGAIRKWGSGTLSLLASNSYTGGTDIQEGAVSFVSGGLGSSGPITFGVGTLRWATGNTQDVSSRIGALGVATFDTNGNNVVFANAIGGGTVGSLTKTGAGTLTLYGTNTYFGATTVSAGTLQLVGTIYSLSAITNNSVLLFDSTSAQSLNSTISGTGSVQKNDFGLLTITGQNSYQGNTTLLAGTTQAGNTQAFGITGTVGLGSNATLQTLTTGGQNGKLTVASLNNAAGGTIRIGG